jgi:hypothetical protein
LGGFSDKLPKLRKMYMRYGSLNIRTVNRVGSLITVSREILNHKLDVVGVEDARWEQGNRTSRRLCVSEWSGE